MKKYLRLLVYMLLVYATIALTAASFFSWYIWPLKPPVSTEQWETITHPQYNFSVDYPTKWTAQTFGEYGYRGAKDLKLSIYRNTFLGLDTFEIEIWYRPMESPTLDDVVTWGDMQFAQGNRSLREQGKEEYKEIATKYDEIDDYPVVKRKSGNNEYLQQDIYIARENDMIIIRYENEINHFEDNLAEAERVIQSFRPLE